MKLGPIHGKLTRWWGDHPPPDPVRHHGRRVDDHRARAPRASGPRSRTVLLWGCGVLMTAFPDHDLITRSNLFFIPLDDQEVGVENGVDLSVEDIEPRAIPPSVP